MGMKGFGTEKKVLICHYRVGWTDGVSLEIDKRVQVLKDSGWAVFLLAGPKSKRADYIIEEMDFDLPEIRKITENSFSGLIDYSNETELLKDIDKYASIIKGKIDEILDILNPDFILLHNIFSHGRHIACAKSFYDVLKERNIPSLATHHDFYWEREHLKTPAVPLIEEFIEKYIPPVLPRLRHAVINSISARKLINKKGITAVVIPDTLNFNLSPWVKDEYNRSFLEDFSLKEDDIFILQATRIVRRKGIELISPILKRLNEPVYLNRLVGRTIYNGKKITEKSRFVFLLAGYAEGEAFTYLEELKKLFIADEIPYCFLESQIASERNIENGIKKYSLFDTYPYSDLVSFPSQVEGWGNQFIEAVFARKPILVFEYPVFRKDIKNEGYKYISLGNIVEKDSNKSLIYLKPDKIDEICEDIIETLLSSDTEKGLNENYRIAEQNNSLNYLDKLMKWSMEHYEE